MASPQTPKRFDNWLIAGCGYTGTVLARRLVAAGKRVTITKRDRAEAQLLAEQLHAAEARSLDLATTQARATDDTIVVCLAPPPTSQLAHFAETAQHLVYVSSTGVYAPGHGQLVDESYPLAPTTKSGIARLAAERELPPNTTILRAAGIYGPGRGLADRLRAGTYRIIGDGTAHVSRIHVDDLVVAIIAAGEQQPRGVFNAADDDPAPIGELADALADHLHVPHPPRVPADQVDAEVAGMLAADRRIDNTKLKTELGVAFRYPTARPTTGSST
ncbi:MAG: NAD-dependent epimerase/dehydratase family protein [Kofleriaceae bacterium]